ncbi:MAG: hypothetical protein ABIQ65_12970 [Thermoanaerobaculia bacterium]
MNYRTRATPCQWRLAQQSFLAGIGLAFSLTAFAGAGVWTSGGPYGGFVSALAINPATPSTLYAGTGGGGVFKTTDSGGTWSAANTDLTTLTVYALAINPTTPSTRERLAAACSSRSTPAAPSGL